MGETAAGDDKALDLFKASFPGRDDVFGAYPTASATHLERALATSMYKEHAADIAFHLSDWLNDAAALMAIHLYPDQFTDEDIEDVVQSFLIHAPNHVAAAAALAGLPVSNIFTVPEPFVDQA